MGAIFYTQNLNYSVEKIILLMYNIYEIVNKGVRKLLLIYSEISKRTDCYFSLSRYRCIGICSFPVIEKKINKVVDN